MRVEVKCPNADCGKTYRIDQEKLGLAAKCTRCGQQFELVAAQEPEPEQAGGSARRGRRLSPDDTSLEMLGRFQVREHIGAGGYGTVYRAHDPLLNREVALKVLRVAAFDNQRAVARFLREPRAAAQLRHPHIVPVYDAGAIGRNYYIASAFISGQTLAAALQGPRLGIRRIAQIVLDLAQALDYAHGLGVVHRDVKPANIMLDAKGDALLADFGLARIEDADEKLTREGSILGTLAYLAPEQASRKFGEVGPQIDQYSLGIVFHEMLCGQRPFAGKGEALIMKILQEDPPAPRSVNPIVPPDLDAICTKACAKNVADRYPSCLELAEDLRRWLDDEPVRARKPGTRERVLRWARKNPLPTAISAISLGLALVSSVAFLSSMRRGSDQGNWRERQRAIERAENDLQRLTRDLDGAQDDPARQTRLIQEFQRSRVSNSARAPGAGTANGTSADALTARRAAD